jgi:UDP-N-acetylglucosamine 3-dehydrogenase
MEPDELAVGVIGVGRMGARHVTTYLRLDETRLCAICDPSREARERALRGARAAEYDDWRRFIDEQAGKLDAVSIVCPSEQHAEVAIAAMQAGLHVLVEKPIATRVEDALLMGRVAKERGVKLLVGHIERFNPAVKKLRSLVVEDRLGRLFRAHATRVGPFPAGIRDTGVAFDLATHDLDAMQYVLQRDITHVYAEGSQVVEDACEDMITCMLQFSGGTLGLLDVNWLTPEKRRELVLLGEAGMVRADYITQDVWFIESGAKSGWSELAIVRGDAEGAAVRFALRKVEPIRAELEAFARCILDDTPEPVTAEDGARALAAASAMLESAALGHGVQPGSATLLPQLQAIA